MSIDFLFADFDRLIQSAESVHRLRRFILDLAVRGKLVPQDPNNEPALKLLERIAIARTASEFKQIRNRRKTVNPSLTKLFFPLPAGWSSACLSDLAEVLNGRAYKKSELLEQGTPVLRVGNLFTSKHWYYSSLDLDENKYCEDGDLIYAWSASFGPFIWRGPRAIFHYHIWKILLFSEDNLNKKFLYNFLLQKTREIKEAGHGVSMVHMTKEKMEQLAVPVPPLSEQNRIVAKIDELMDLCDQLEAVRAEREGTQDRLATASLARVNAPDPDPAMFQHDVAFAVNNLAPLTTRPDQIKALRQAILNLAVRGRLSVQESSEGDVEDLLDQLSIQQKRLIARKKLKRSVVTCNLKNQDNLASIPNSWRWVPLGKLISFGPQNGISPRATNSPDTPRAITLTATTSGTFDASHFKHVEADVPADSEYWLRDGDLLFQRGNTREYVGIAAYYSEASGIFLYPDLIIKVRLLHGLYLPYVHLALVSPGARTYFSTNATGAQETMPKINQQTLLNAPVPLPPLAEQHRIVTKVDELMALCDRLEASLVTGGETRGRLVEACCMGR